MILTLSVCVLGQAWAHGHGGIRSDKGGQVVASGDLSLPATWRQG
ncbi:hypothetical protein [Pseudomonas sp. GD03944]|nr:hypothetical protein [Pseudomonas sp. GD03944]MDH1265649.1 hypothetical protein [Pseudomonas sp. GD03944]